ncbi:hypothetical protein [Nocardia sp. NBC_01388]|uniref:hypothetical protein n=1 Tax=Nocardia sp. NBC_01388 TaxID=2903596 RepID=UPI00324E29F1
MTSKIAKLFQGVVQSLRTSVDGVVVSAADELYRGEAGSRGLIGSVEEHRAADSAEMISATDTAAPSRLHRNRSGNPRSAHVPTTVRELDLPQSGESTTGLDTPTVRLRGTSAAPDTPTLRISKTYDTTEMKNAGTEYLSRGWQPGVRYYGPIERQQFALTVREGRLYDARGVPFDTATAVSHWGGEGRAIFVMDRRGRIYASNEHGATLKHSSFLAGDPVAAAGELTVAEGRITLISDNSGHYRPPRRYTFQLIDRLKRQGIDVDDIAVEMRARR